MTDRNFVSAEITLTFVADTASDLNYALKMLQEHHDNLSVVVGEGNHEMDLIVDKAELTLLQLHNPVASFRSSL